MKYYYMLSKIIKPVSVPLVSKKEGDFSLFRLFKVLPGLLEAVLACHGFFRIIPLFKSDGLNQLHHVRFYCLQSR